MYTGLTGSLKMPSGIKTLDNKDIFIPIAYISGWSIEDSAEIIETIKLGQKFKSAVPGYHNWSASADGTLSFEGVGSHEKLFNAKQSSEKIKLKFYLDTKDKESDSTFFEGDCYIESISIDLSAEDKSNVSISVTGAGPLKLFVNGVEAATGEVVQLSDIEFFNMKVDNNGDLLVTYDVNCPFKFILTDGLLTVKMVV